MVAPSPVSWPGLWCRGGLCTAVLYITTTSQAPLATTNSHQRTHGCYLGLRRPDRTARVDSTTTTSSHTKVQKYFHRQKYWNKNLSTGLQPLFSVSIQFVFCPFLLYITADSYNLYLDGTLHLRTHYYIYLYTIYIKSDRQNVWGATDERWDGRKKERCNEEEVNVMFGCLPGVTGTSQDHLFHWFIVEIKNWLIQY